MEESREIRWGSRGEYHWLTSEAHYIGELVELCPALFLGRFLVVVCIDSGAPWLTEAQKTAGWQLEAGVLYSPRLDTLAQLHFQNDRLEQSGYDEWYLFDSPAPHFPEPIVHPRWDQLEAAPGDRPLVFVNWLTFHPHREPLTVIEEAFWRQMPRMQAVCYVCDGQDCVSVVTNNERLRQEVRRALQEDLAAKAHLPLEI